MHDKETEIDRKRELVSSDELLVDYHQRPSLHQSRATAKLSFWKCELCKYQSYVLNNIHVLLVIWKRRVCYKVLHAPTLKNFLLNQPTQRSAKVSMHEATHEGKHPPSLSPPPTRPFSVVSHHEYDDNTSNYRPMRRQSPS